MAMNKGMNELDRVFNPRTVAVVGDKREMGYMWLKSLSTFQGKVYSVQIDPNELAGIEALGVENHSSLLDIPEPVDYVVIAVPRAVTPRIVADCVEKGVGGVTLFTSGFAETNTEEGIRLQRQLTEMARAAGLNLIGPNCMGIFNPKIGVRHSPDQYAGEGGSAGFISQSGTIATFFGLAGALNGVKVSKSVSYGNAIVLDSTDFLEYLAQDEQTKIIGMYIEGLKDGRRFFDCLKRVAREKPVFIWKGGDTEAGTRATASHTASMAESPAIWQALMRQSGAIKVDNLDEMIDTAKLLLHARPVAGERVGLVAATGGQSVAISDAFAKAGLRVPCLSQDSYQELASFFDIIGASYQNPFDVSSNLRSLENVLRILDILDGDENIDSVVLEFSIFLLARWMMDPQSLDGFLDGLARFKARSAKPFLTVLVSVHMEERASEVRHKLTQRDIPCFPSFERGAGALRKMVDYYRFRQVEGIPV